MFDRVRTAAQSALHAQDELLAALRDFHKQSVQDRLAKDDVAVLQQLVVRRIYPVSAFDVLIRHDAEAAIEVLRRSLPKDVDPERGFGGFFDLETMLADLVQVRGEAALRKLIQHPLFNKKLLDDQRFLDSLSFALDAEPAKVTEWLRQTP